MIKSGGITFINEFGTTEAFTLIYDAENNNLKVINPNGEKIYDGDVEAGGD